MKIAVIGGGPGGYVAAIKAAMLGAEVTLNVDKPESEHNKIADIKIEIAGKDLFASKQADTFEEAVMLAIDALKTQISKYKDKK